MSLASPKGDVPTPLREWLVAMARHAGELLRQSPVTAPFVVRVSRQLVRTELRRLHDVLAATPLAERYWLFGGILLGWARDGDVLPHDTADVDVAFHEEDFEAMVAAIGPLGDAGFQLSRVLRNNDGVLTQFVFERSGIHFDFLCLSTVEDRFRYFGYFEDVQIVAEIPAQRLVPFEFAGKTWLKAEDHDKDLSALYGDWRTPQTDWRTDRDSPAVVARSTWTRPPFDGTFRRRPSEDPPEAVRRSGARS